MTRYCLRCGGVVEGSFCPQCRSAVKAAGPALNRACAQCYALLALTGFFFLARKPHNRSRRVRFHALQSIYLNVAAVAAWIAIMVLLFVVHLAGVFLGLSLWPPLGLAFICLWIYVMASAYRGKTVILPVIGPMAQQRV